METVLTEKREEPVVENCRRVGAYRNKSTRLVKFSLRSYASYDTQVSNSTKKLRSVDEYKSVKFAQAYNP